VEGTTATDSWAPPLINADGARGDLMTGEATFANGKKYKLFGKIV
jgi:hypothetical protein